MARTKQNQRPATVTTASTRGKQPPSKLTISLLTLSALAAVWAVAMLTPAGRVAYVYLFFYTEFYAGVLVLVSLSLTVMAGVLSTDRLVLQIPHRVLLQQAHRITGTMAVSSLLLHLMTQVSMGTITWLDVFIPFLATNRAAFIGLGTIASYFMFAAFWVGIVRARFVGRGKPWMWRALHSVAYVSWPIAIVHGLNTGRPAATFVFLSYVGCVLLVLIALTVRLSISVNRRKAFLSSTSGTMAMVPVGRAAPAADAGRGASAARPRRKPARESAGKAEVAVERVSSRSSRRASGSTAVLESRAPERRRTRRSEEEKPARERARRTVDADDERRSSRDERRSEPRDERRSEPRDERRSESRDDRRRAEPAPRRAVEDDYDLRDAPRRAEPAPRRAAEDDYDLRDTPRRSQPAPRRAVEDDYDLRDARPAPADDYRAAGPSARRRAAQDDYDAPPRRREAPQPRRSADEEYDRPPARRAAADDYRSAAPAGEAGYPPPREARRRSADDRVSEQPRHPVDDYLAGVDYPPADAYPPAGRYADGARRGADDLLADYRSEDALSSWSSGYTPSGPRSRWADGERRDPAAEQRSRQSAAAAPRLGPEPPRMDSRAAALGRHSRQDAYDPAGPGVDYGAADSGYDSGPQFLPPDDTPTLIDMASRRARRAGAEGGRASGRSRRGRRTYEDSADEMYWRQLRGEAQ